MTINEKIQNIIDQRIGRGQYEGKGHLGKIREKKNFFEELKAKVLKYEALRRTILSQINEQKGEYYSIAMGDPTFNENVINSNPDKLISYIEKSLNECDILEHRFEKETINISVIGRAGQGKSMLLQSISGLSNEIIPADSGGDCTGAKSVICNDKCETKAFIRFLTETELCEQVKKYLDSIVGSSIFPIGGISDIKNLNIERVATYVGESNAKQSQFEQLRKYVDHYEEYVGNLSKTIEVPASDIRKYVAQYLSDKKPVYYYLGVKEVEIHTPFNYNEAGKIMLVDTIGLGDTSIGLRDKLIETMVKESDAAILLRRPEKYRDGIREEDNQLYDFINDKMQGRAIEKWLFYALNIWEENADNGETLYKSLTEKLTKSTLKAAFIKKVNCADSKDVENNLLVPMLEFLTTNISGVDNNLMYAANIVFQETYTAYFNLLSHLKNLLNSNFKQSITVGGLFDDLYEDDLHLPRALNRLHIQYEGLNECQLIMEQVKGVISTMADCVPEQDEIIKELTEGDLRSRKNTVLDETIDFTRSKISDKFEEVNNKTIFDLQEGVKQEIVSVFKADDGGKLGRISLSENVSDEDYNKWLELIIDEKLSDFPIVKSAFESILNYRLNVEGLIEYKVNGVLENLLDPNKETLQPLPIENAETVACQIEQILLSKMALIGTGVTAAIVEVLLIPYSSFRARVKKLQEKLIFSKAGRRELKNFYRENCGAIWSQQMSEVNQKQTAISEIKEICDDLSSSLKEDQFVIK